MKETGAETTIASNYFNQLSDIDVIRRLMNQFIIHVIIDYYTVCTVFI